MWANEHEGSEIFYINRCGTQDHIIFSNFTQLPKLDKKNSLDRMSRHLHSPRKRNTQSSTHDNSWFEALEIIDENDSGYLVRWAGTDKATGKEWPPSWV